ncbi:hypothetical protein O3689_00435 [Prevotella nigrescens]|uniref:hypothetical protein n=1 Tax=Prevotella nigrescens TaxID=28133 RepID=UPI00352F0ADB
MKSNILSFIAVSALLAFMASCSNDDIAQSAGNSEETTVGKENTNLNYFRFDRPTRQYWYSYIYEL